MERNSTDRGIADLSDRVGRFESRVGRFEEKVDERFDKVDKRFDKVDKRFDRIDAHFATWGKILGSAVVTIAVAVALKILGVDA